MSPVTGPQRNKSADNENAQHNAYQEIHAAILELYRLMGAPRSLPTTASPQYFPGYSVYTYPAAAQPAPYAASSAATYLGAWPTQVTPSPMVNPYGQPTGYVQNAPNNVQTWASGSF